mgnify:CR=1 FL=1
MFNSMCPISTTETVTIQSQFARCGGHRVSGGGNGSSPTRFHPLFNGVNHEARHPNKRFPREGRLPVVCEGSAERAVSFLLIYAGV